MTIFTPEMPNYNDIKKIQDEIFNVAWAHDPEAAVSPVITEFIFTLAQMIYMHQDRKGDYHKQANEQIIKVCEKIRSDM